MLAKLKSSEQLDLKLIVEKPQADERSEAELRRQMYERIAQGNALAEVEDHARRLWKRA